MFLPAVSITGFTKFQIQKKKQILFLSKLVNHSPDLTLTSSKLRINSHCNSVLGLVHTYKLI